MISYPHISVKIEQGKRKFPDVGFQILNHEGVPLEAHIRIRVNDTTVSGDHYSGIKEWKLLPSAGINGHFTCPIIKAKEIYANVHMIIIDSNNSKFCYPSQTFVYMPDKNSWYLDP